MTQEEMNLVLTAAINFGMNNNMSSELHEVKQHNLELLIDNAHKTTDIESLQHQLQDKDEEISRLKYTRFTMQDARITRPEHGKLYLCIHNWNPSTVIEGKNLTLLKYNDKAKYWDAEYADVDNDSHDDGVFDYGDHKVQFFMEIDPTSFFFDNNSKLYSYPNQPK